MKEEKRNWLKDPEMITALSAVFIGVVALVIGAYQAKVASDQRAASVWPYIEISRSSIQGETYKFIMTNKGVGPALIKQMDVEIEGQGMKNWSSAFQTMIDEKIDIPSIYGSSNKSVVAVQEKITMINLTNKDIIKKIQASQKDNIVIKVCYCSIFEDCWVAGRGIKTKSVATCEGYLPDLFTQ